MKYTELHDFAKELIAAGFDVYAQPDATWLHFTDGENIGYCQFDPYRGFGFSTVHKPNKQTGTGFDAGCDIWPATIDHAKEAFAFAPAWADRTDIASVRKYSSMGEWLTANPFNAKSTKVKV